MCSSQLDRGYGVQELMQNQRLRPKSQVYTVLIGAFKINSRSFNIKLFASITRSDAELEALYRAAPDSVHIAPEQVPLPSACGGWSGSWPSDREQCPKSWFYRQEDYNRLSDV